MRKLTIALFFSLLLTASCFAEGWGHSYRRSYSYGYGGGYARPYRGYNRYYSGRPFRSYYGGYYSPGYYASPYAYSPYVYSYDPYDPPYPAYPAYPVRVAPAPVVIAPRIVIGGGFGRIWR